MPSSNGSGFCFGENSTSISGRVGEIRRNVDGVSFRFKKSYSLMVLLFSQRIHVAYCSIEDYLEKKELRKLVAKFRLAFIN